MSSPSLATAAAPTPAPTAVPLLMAAFTLALLLGLQPVTTDLYLPSLPILSRELGGSMVWAQLTMSVLEPAGAMPLVANLPDGVEVSIRQADKHDLIFVLNTTADPVTLPDGPQGTELLNMSATTGQLTLGPYGVAVIKRPR